MKKYLLILAVCVMVCFCGCGNPTPEEKAEKHISKQFVLLETFDYDSGLCYDKDTMIIYVYSCNHTSYEYDVVSYTPYYVMNNDNEPVIAVYNGDEID